MTKISRTRVEALEMFLKALEIKPDLIAGRAKSGSLAGKLLVDGAREILNFIDDPNSPPQEGEEEIF